jgi:hypothetical protein
MQTSWSLPLVQHPAYGGDGNTPERPYVPPLGGAPVSVVCAPAAALLRAARRAGTVNMVLCYTRCHELDHGPECAVYATQCGHRLGQANVQTDGTLTPGLDVVGSAKDRWRRCHTPRTHKAKPVVRILSAPIAKKDLRFLVSP